MRLVADGGHQLQVINSIFDIRFLCYRSGYQSVGFLPHALLYMLVCHSGELLVYIVAPASVSSPAYAGKVGELPNFGGDEMLKLIGGKDAFCFYTCNNKSGHCTPNGRNS